VAGEGVWPWRARQGWMTAFHPGPAKRPAVVLPFRIRSGFLLAGCSPPPTPPTPPTLPTLANPPTPPSIVQGVKAIKQDHSAPSRLAQWGCRAGGRSCGRWPPCRLPTRCTSGAWIGGWVGVGVGQRVRLVRGCGWFGVGLVRGQGWLRLGGG